MVDLAYTEFADEDLTQVALSFRAIISHLLEGEGLAGLRLSTRSALLDGFRRYAQPVCRTRRQRLRWHGAGVP